MATAIFYASNTGNTEDGAKKIAKELDIKDIFDIASGNILLMKNYDRLIIGSSTWGEGDLQDDWEESWEQFQAIDFEGKIVALFGYGDQEQYSDNFVDAMGKIYEVIIKSGGKVIGNWNTNEYDFDESKAILDNETFVGLALDEDNQAELTDERIKMWCNQIRDEIV